MKREPVKSSFITSIGWENGTLEIKFSNDQVWQYFGVPPETWAGFRIAPSQGKFFHNHIKDKYAEGEVTRIEELPSVGPA